MESKVFKLLSYGSSFLLRKTFGQSYLRSVKGFTFLFIFIMNEKRLNDKTKLSHYLVYYHVCAKLLVIQLMLSYT